MAFGQFNKESYRYKGKRVLTRHERQSKRRVWLFVVFVIFFVSFVVSAFLFLNSYFSEKAEAQAFEELAELANRNKKATVASQTESSQLPDVDAADPVESLDDDTLQLIALHDRNSDFCGWLSIEGTNINYPVMLTPEEPEYYLRRDFDKNDSNSGTPFIGEGCNLSSDNIIIYGHNMKNGTMFSDLTRYSEKGYMELHSVISFDSLDGSADYEVIAAFQDRVHYQDEKEVFRYYEYGGSLSEEQFMNYVESIENLSFYDTETSVSYGDQLLTLSTCSYHTRDGRFVVVAKRVH